MRSAHRHGEFLTHWGCNRPYSLSELAEPIPRGWRLPVKPTTEAGRNCALFVVLMKWAGLARYTRFSARNAVRPVLQARPGGIRDSLRREASQAAGAAPTLRYGPAGDSAPRLRLKAAGMTERFPFGPAGTARKSTPRCPFGRIAIYGYRTLSNEIQNHWPPGIFCSAALD